MLSKLLHNFWLKIFSLVLATIIWVTIHIGIKRDISLTNPDPTQASRKLMTLPISIITQPGDARVFKINPTKTQATVMGGEAFIRRMSDKDIRIYVDLTDTKSRGILTNELHSDAPKEITVTDLNPTFVEVEQISP